MTHRPRVAHELTEEDFQIAVDVWTRTRFPWFWSKPADHRDAEVMLQLTIFDHWERDYTQDRSRRWPTAQRLVARVMGAE